MVKKLMAVVCAAAMSISCLSLQVGANGSYRSNDEELSSFFDNLDLISIMTLNSNSLNSSRSDSVALTFKRDIDNSRKSSLDIYGSESESGKENYRSNSGSVKSSAKRVRKSSGSNNLKVAKCNKEESTKPVLMGEKTSNEKENQKNCRYDKEISIAEQLAEAGFTDVEMVQLNEDNGDNAAAKIAGICQEQYLNK